MSPDSASRRTTREHPPEPALLRLGAEALATEATRLDAAYQSQMEALSLARKAEAALLGSLLGHVRPVLPALSRPVLLLDVRAPGRPQLLHVRAVLLFGELPGPRTACHQGCWGVFLLEDASFLRVRFTGATASTPGKPPALCAERLEGVDVRGVLRDHAVEEVTDVLLRAMAAETAHRGARARDVAAYAARLQAVRVLLAG